MSGLEPSYENIIKQELEVADLKRAIAEKDREIAELKEWKSIILGTGTNQEAVIRMAAAEYTQVAVQTWKQAYHALMGKAIEFAQYLDTAFWPGNNAVEKAQEFLTSPEVRTWREQEGKK